MSLFRKGEQRICFFYRVRTGERVMKRFFEAISNIFEKLIFDDSLKISVARALFAFVLGGMVLFAPFTAAAWFRYFLFVVCGGAFISIFSKFKLQKKKAFAAFVIFVVLLFLIYYGRGDAVSGCGIAVFSILTAAGALRLTKEVRGKFTCLLRGVCGVCAIAVAVIIISCSSQLGVRYLDQLHSCSLVMAGCGFVNLFIMRKV